MPRSQLSPRIDSPADEVDRRLIGGRFAVERCLGHRQGSEISLALDKETQKQVVVKSTPADNFTAGALMRLEFEASLVLEMQSEWLQPLVDQGREGDMVYVAWEFAA